jgi:hypothetical protein
MTHFFLRLFWENIRVYICIWAQCKLEDVVQIIFSLKDIHQVITTNLWILNYSVDTSVKLHWRDIPEM